MLESTGGGLDQSAATRKRRHCGYVGNGCLTGGRGVIFPGSYRPSRSIQGMVSANLIKRLSPESLPPNGRKKSAIKSWWRCSRRYMWKTLGDFSANLTRIFQILPLCTAQINCSGSGLTFIRRPMYRSLTRNDRGADIAGSPDRDRSPVDAT